MSVYRNQYLQTLVIDPVLHNNNRCVFKIPAVVCAKKSMCLSDLGVSLSGVCEYNLIGGVANIIRTISLRVSGTQLDFNNNVRFTNVLENLRSSCSKANNIDNKTVKNSLDFMNSQVTFPITVALEDQNQRLVASNTRARVTDNADGKVYLYQLLQFFNGNHNVEGVTNELLPLYMFKDAGDIELTIEWETNPALIVNAAVNITGVRQPVLLMDAFDKSSMIYNALDNVKVPLAVNFSRWEYENLQYKANGAIVRERLNQPTGKYVKRLCMFANSNEANLDLAQTRATALPLEQIQVVVNGKQALDFRSQDAAEKCMHFCNAWGDYILPTGGREYGKELTSASVTLDAPANTLSPIVGNTSLFGLILNSRVEYMELDYQYFEDLAKPVAAGQLNFIYETENIVGVMNGQLTLSY